ncbi:hypothetical protein PGB90_007299 [Kerria lacca]
MTKIKFSENHVLLDIEGTISSVSFVKDILFPCIRENLKQYIEDNWSKQEFRSILNLLKKQFAEDVANKVENLVPIVENENEKDSVIQNVLYQMDLDRKNVALKKLQGNILKNVFHSGKLKGHVYDDVVPALKSWKKNGKKLYIYSSGSVEAQKLLFRYSVYGDILDLFCEHFDTEIGFKTDPKSYTNIAKTIGCFTTDIIFVTDVIKEAEAASEAGCRVVISLRPGNYPISDSDKIKYECIYSFAEMSPE